MGAVLLATLFTLILAVFAMHAMANHHHAHATAEAALPLGVADAGAAHVGGHSSHGQPAPDGVPAPHEEPDQDGSLAGACFALLCLMAASVLVALLRGRPQRPLFVLQRMRTRLPVLGRPLEPPCLYRLSILRC